MKKVYLIAAVCALISGLLLYSYLGTLQSEAQQDAPQISYTDVVVALNDIPAYTEITEEMLTMQSVPTEGIHASAALSYDQVVGLMCDGTIVAGETILTNKLSEAGEIGDSLAYLIPDGMRAMTISVSAETGVAGFLTTGDFVDVLAYVEEDYYYDENDVPEGMITTGDITVEVESSAGKSTVVADAVEILKVGDITYADGTVYTTLTLALTPEQCHAVFAAEQAGALCVSLRSAGDTAPVSHEVYDFTDLYGE